MWGGPGGPGGPGVGLTPSTHRTRPSVGLTTDYLLVSSFPPACHEAGGKDGDTTP